MFLRAITKNYPSGPVKYLYLLQGYRDKGRVRQRVVANLGRADQLAPHLETLICLLSPYTNSPLAIVKDGAEVSALTYGPVAVARKLWCDLGLDKIISNLLGPELADRVFVLVAHRLINPGSEHALAWWLEESFVTDRCGKRIMAKWKQNGRVRVAHAQLMKWYRALDALLPIKQQIEQELYLSLRDLFGLKVELVFYDLTSTYFEGTGPKPLAVHGHSRDGKARNRQVLLGMVMASGWPIASHIFEGNLPDKATVKKVVDDTSCRFDLKRVVWVTDRGMVTAATLKVMGRYLVGVNRRRSREAAAVLAAAGNKEGWTVLREGGCVVEVSLGDRYFVIQSPERLIFERLRRKESMRRCRDRLAKLKRQVDSGRIRAPERIGERVGKILKDNHGDRYFSWRIDEAGVFDYFVDKDKLRLERRLEGTYIIKTNEPDITPEQAVSAYKELQEVERAFRSLKDVLCLRPVYHSKVDRVSAHLFVAHLALVLGCALKKALKRADLTLDIDTALAALKAVRLVTIELDERPHAVLTKPNPHAQAVLKAIGLGQLGVPPTSCETP